MTLELNNLKLAVIGSRSMVGSRFCELAKNDFDLIEADLNGPVKLDITNTQSVSELFDGNQFDYAVLFSAFTDVDAAEKQRDDKDGICWRINVGGVKNIVDKCKETGRGLIFISTDFVFDGEDGPYGEDAQTGKNLGGVSWYGVTKIEGEKLIQNQLEKYIIVRISYPYRGRFSEKDDFLKRIARQYEQNSLYPMFADQQITPTFIDDVAPAIKAIVESGQNGIYNLASSKLTTPFEISQSLLSKFYGEKDKVQAGSLSEFMSQPGRTPRPVKGGLATDKIKSVGFVPTNWDDGIEKIYEQTEGKLI